MHAVYSFLITLPRPCRRYSGTAIRELAEEAYDEYAEQYCDSNNWATKMRVVTEDNRELLCKNVDNTWFADDLDKFEAARRFAVGCLCADADYRLPEMRLADNRADHSAAVAMATMSTASWRADTLLCALHEDLRVRLSREYLLTRLPVRLDLVDYSRSQRVKIFERLRRSVRYGGWYLSPFDVASSPDDGYRAISLIRHYERVDNNALILLVDIHT